MKGPSTVSRRARRQSKRHRPDSTEDESFVNSASPPPGPLSSDSDHFIQRYPLRPRPLPAPISFGSSPAALDHSGSIPAVAAPISHQTSLQLDDAIATTAAQSASKQAATLDTFLSSPPATDPSTHPAWLAELEARRASAQRFLQAHPSRPLPWHMAIVLANSTFALQTIQQIQCHPVHWSPSTSAPASPASEPAPLTMMPSPQKSSPADVFPDVVSASRRASSPDSSAYETRTDDEGNRVRVSTRRRQPALPDALPDGAVTHVLPATEL